VGTQQTAVSGQLLVVRVYSLLGFLSVTVFGLLHIIVEKNPGLGYLELAGGLVMALNVLALRVTDNVGLARDLFLLTLIALLLVMLASGGTAGTGIFWFFLFPVAAFFLTSKRQGVCWVGGLLGAVALLWVMRSLDVIDLWYGDIVIRQLLVSMAVVGVGIYVYQAARERSVRRGDESQHDLQEYLDRMTTFNAKLNPAGTVLFANKAIKQASGMGERLLGVDFFTGPWWSFDSRVQVRVQAAFRRALQGEAVNYDEQLQIVTKEGPKQLTVNFSIIPVQSAGRTKYLLAEGRDITAEEEVNRAKSEFVTLASHQLRTPISAIRWFSEMLIGGDAGQLTGEQKEHVEHIYHSNQRLASLVDEMLLVSSLELGSLPIRPEPLDVPAFCRKIVRAQLEAAAPKQLTLKDRYDTDLPKLSYDPHILKNILGNIISNAIKYTPKNGSISLEIMQTTKKVTPESRGSLVIILNDNGYGIPKVAQDKIFTKFFRAKNIKDKDTDGTGLGLYVAKLLLGYVGGRISFSSTENVGSTFVVELPLEGMAEHHSQAA
jgi:signal transduction histidine kinase